MSTEGGWRHEGGDGVASRHGAASVSSPGSADDRSVPDGQLRLEWVYGYQGKEYRDNLCYNRAGNVVYFVAGVCIVHDAEERKQTYYRQHHDDVSCLCIHPKKELVASGEVAATATNALEPSIFVWDSDSLETKSILKGMHKGTIVSVGFGGPGDKLLVSASSDDANTVVVWQWRQGTPLSSTSGSTAQITTARFNPYESNILASCDAEMVRFWTLSGNVMSAFNGVVDSNVEPVAQLCLAFGPDRITYSGGADGDIWVWKGNHLKAVIAAAHGGAITSISMCKDGYASAAMDGSCRLWDPRFEPIATIDLMHSPKIGYPTLAVSAVCWAGRQVLCGTEAGEIIEVSYERRDPTILVQGHPAAGELWGLATHPVFPIFATASEDKTIRIWHARHKQLLGHAVLPEAARCVAFSNDPDGKQHVAVGMKKGRFAVFSLDSLVKGFKLRSDKPATPQSKQPESVDHVPYELGHVVSGQPAEKVVHEIKYSPNNQYLAVGSNDGDVHFYEPRRSYEHAGSCRGLESYVTHIDFDFEGTLLQINTGAGAQHWCSVPSGSRLSAEAVLDRHPRWRTWTSICGREMNGIWGKFYAEPDDVNACHAAAGVVVTGDDYGKVKLYRFPCISKGAKFREYRGHSAHVTNTRFLADERRLISTGGADHSIFQWRYHRDGGAVQTPGHESHEEESDSDESDAEIDSDIERESAATFGRDPEKAARVKVRRANNLPRSKPPDTKLQLERVHGYRGYDCRDNMTFIASGELVYHIAAVGVVFDIEANTQRFYQQHDDDILCLGHHPKGEFIATGQIGRSAEIHVWSSTTLRTKAVLRGHERGVCAVDFHSDNKRLISVGLDTDHMVIAWDWAKGTKLAEARGHRDKIFAIKWNPFSKNGAVTVGVRHLKFWTQAGSGFTSKRGVFGKKGKVETMTSIEFDHRDDGEFVITGGTNGMVYEWKDNVLQRCIAAHTGPVYVLNIVAGMPVSGGKDGVLKIWPADFDGEPVKEYPIFSTKLKDMIMPNPCIRAIAVNSETHAIAVGTANSEVILITSSGEYVVLTQGHGDGEVWGLSTSATDDTFCTASDDRTVRVWNANEHTMQLYKKLPKPARSCALSPSGGMLAVGTKDGTVVVYVLPAFELYCAFEHRKREISDLKFSPNGNYLAAGSHDQKVDIYDVGGKRRVGVCKGASSYITHVDWDATGKLIKVNTGAKEVIYFEAPKGKRQSLPAKALASMQWASYTGVLGKETQGVWPPNSDVTDVNAGHITATGTIMATGDDFGMVKLFQYPALGSHAKFKKYLGHSAHVTNVRWLHDNSRLISIGGADTMIAVWRFISPEQWEAEQARADDTVAGGDGRGGGSSIVGTAGESDDSDTDDDEEGYDSDVEREKRMDYGALTYAEPLRVTAGVRPNMQGLGSTGSGSKISRTAKRPRVQRRQATDGGAKPGAGRKRIVGATLEHVHGYRGYDCRDNLQYNGDGFAVYHAAAAGIVLDPQTNRQSFYLEHTDDIVSLDVNPYPKYSNVVATGQIGDDADIHIWETTSSQTLSIIRGFHRTAVCALSFSSNGKLLLSVDASEDHGIAVYKWTTGMLMASSSGHHSRVFVAKFRPGTDDEFVTCGVKHVRFWSVTGSTLRSVKGVIGGRRMPTMLSLTFGAAGVSYTGSVNGEIFQWATHTLVRIVAAHVGPIFSMTSLSADAFGADADACCVVSGGKDSVLRFWKDDLSSTHHSTTLAEGTMVRSIGTSKSGMLHANDVRKVLVGTRDGQVFEVSGSDQRRQLSYGHSLGELWALAVHPSAAMFASGSDDKTICTWDLDTHQRKGFKKLAVGCRSLAFSPDGEALAAGMTNGTIVVLSSSNLKELFRFRDRKGPTNVVKYSPDGRFLMTGSEQGAVDVYSVGDRYSRLGYTGGSDYTGPPEGNVVLSVDWATDGTAIQIDTSDYEHVCLTLPDLKPGPHANRTWASWSSVLGDEAAGIWPKSADKADVNCCDLAHDGETIATGDDFGAVKFFRFPALAKHSAPVAKQVGHSAHVTNVRFSYDDEQVVSTGGADSCVFVWKTDFDGPAAPAVVEPVNSTQHGDW